MSGPVSARVLAALHAGGPIELRAVAPTAPDGAVLIEVDDVDRRYRDAIKAGAEPIEPPSDATEGGRAATLLDRATGATLVIRRL